ncbi:MAG: hypothetical protein GWP04_11000, partial [Gammaproteobacteria bacterium]|nr:hypothetical protein [Gammaproteobacteria bacterium]
MARPRVYYVRPRDDSSSARQGQAKGWSWVDKIGSFLGRIDPILGICADRGYEVVKCEGCTHAQLNELLEDPDTYGVILAGWHGASAGIQLDAPGAHGETHTLEYKTEAFNKQWRISDQPNPNLRFVVFHACDVSAKTLSGYLDRLRPLAGDVEVLGWPEESLLSIEGLPQTIYSVCHELPNMTSPAASATSFGLDPSLASDDG